MTLLALLLVQLLFGALPIATRIATRHTTPLDLVVARTFGAMMIFGIWGFAVACRRHRGLRNFVLRTKLQKQADGPARMKDSQWWRRQSQLFALAACGACLNQYMLFLGVTHAGALMASIVVPTIPLFTVLIAVAGGRERFRLDKLIICLIGLAGVLVLLGPPLLALHFANSLETVKGIVYCTLSAFLSALFLVYSKPVAETLGAARMLRAIYAYGCAASVLLASIFEGEALGAPFARIMEWIHFSAAFWFAVAFIIFGSTALANFLNMFAIRRVQASTVGGFVFLQTLVGVLLSAIVLRETLSTRHVVATCFIMAGLAGLSRIALVERRSMRHATKPSANPGITRTEASTSQPARSEPS